MASKHNFDKLTDSRGDGHGQAGDGAGHARPRRPHLPGDLGHRQGDAQERSEGLHPPLKNKKYAVVPTRSAVKHRVPTQNPRGAKVLVIFQFLHVL